MSESKAAAADNDNNNGRDAATGHERSTATQPRQRHPAELTAGASGAGNGLEAYRRWLTRVRAPANRRAPLDASLYTWKGYRNWSEKVRREWKPED